MENQFKKKLLAGKRMVGTEVDLCDPCVTEMMGQQGFDFIWIDTEHEAIDYHTALMHIIAAKAAGTASLVRIPWNEPYLAKRILEMGPDAIIFPQVSNAQELKKAADACLYPPLGNRGFGPRRACGYGAEDLMQYIRESSDRMCCLAQIESVEAVHNLDEMLQVPYVHGFIIGPCDLSGTVGRLNDIFHPEVMELIDTVIAKCNAANRAVGIAVGSIARDDMQFWYNKGIQFISAGNDISAIVHTAKAQFKTMSEVFYS